VEVLTRGEFTYIDRGQGPVVVILHGLFGSLSNFENLISMTENRYRFIMPVLPLYDCDVKHANLDGMLDYFRRFITELNITDYSILGNSLGGHVALLNELKFPDSTKSLILTGSSGLFENSLGNDYPRRDKEGLRAKLDDIFGNKKMITDELVDEVAEIVSSYSKILRIIRMAKSATRQNLTYEIEKIKTKTMLIWGEEDKITPPFVANQFHDKMTASELAWIPNCGHAPMMEYPKEFAQILLPFLDKIYNENESK
jgi:2-hydroxy-6-oxonona-2,4-dienedioate hydrolase